MSTFTFATVPQIIAGPGSIARLSELKTGLGSRVLVISDDGVVRAGLVQPALASLSEGGAETSIFTGVVADPPETVIHDAVARAIDFGATGILGIGGGSSLDVAKLVALLARSGEALGDIYGVGKVTGERLPLVLVPTTAGTGSEVTPISIVTTDAHQKKGVVSPTLLPDAAILDASLTVGLPPAVTAATGIDAMVHAIEAFTSASANNNPVSRTLAKEALRLLGANIEIAVKNGAEMVARQAMLLGAMLAGQAFANSPLRPFMLSPTRLAASIMFRTGSPTAWSCHMCCVSTQRCAAMPMRNWRHVFFLSWSLPTGPADLPASWKGWPRSPGA